MKNEKKIEGLMVKCTKMADREDGIVEKKINVEKYHFVPGIFNES